MFIYRGRADSESRLNDSSFPSAVALRARVASDRARISDVKDLSNMKMQMAAAVQAMPNCFALRDAAAAL